MPTKFRSTADIGIATGLGLFSLGLYVRTLAPDILYGDSGEFQTLAYTLGYTHSTGYPVYLLLARLVGFLPVGNLAWRINLLSAICAAMTIAFIYLLGRFFTPDNRWGALLGSLALAVSYTFWSQAIIAEVYTPALALIAASLYLLLRWQEQPGQRVWCLFLAAVLIGGGVGVHAFVGLLAPAAVVLVVWVLLNVKNDPSALRNNLIAAIGGTLLGIAILFLGFLFIDLNDPPSSFFRVMLEPCRSLWGLKLEDIDSPLERIYYTFSGLQWRDAMFPEGLNFVSEYLKFQSRLVQDEFGVLFYGLSLLGLFLLIRRNYRAGWFVFLNFICFLFYILHYQPPDKYIFYLPISALLCVTVGVGANRLSEWFADLTGTPQKSKQLIHFGLFLMLILGASLPFLPSRIEALKAGKAVFVKEDYVFPVKSLGEPRAVAKLYLYSLPDDAVLIMDWRALYATLFVAHVEGKNPGLRVIEAMPHGNKGVLADSLVEMLRQYLLEGRPVYANGIYGDVERHFELKKIEGSGLYQLFMR